MSRSGYTDDFEDMWGHIRWRGAVSSALGGARGQAALREVLAALDAMPEKELIGESLVTADGEFCTLGVLGAKRGLDMSKVDPEDYDAVAKLFGLAPAMVREIVFENDEQIDNDRDVYVEICGPMRPHYPDWGRHERHYYEPDPQAGKKRWVHMRQWIVEHIKENT